MPTKKEEYMVRYRPITIGRDDTSEEKETGPFRSWRAAMREVKDLEWFHATHIKVVKADNGAVVYKG